MSTRHVTAQLGCGPVRGLRRDDHLAFRGIPYAAAPAGELRWRAPQPVEPWAGVLDATASGNPAPQLGQSFTDITALDEDCLTLDVTVPDTPGTGRPVVVWLHGGGGTNGSAALYDPRRLAVTGDVVVVAPTFRLGVLACFGHRGLDSGGTFGLQDQQAALRWVQREIATFGGDPGNVTLMGVSSGALAVAAHLAAPGSGGLFHRAVLQSVFGVAGPTPAHTLIPGIPAMPSMWVPSAGLAETGTALALEHGWVRPGSDPGSALDQLRRVPVRDLLAASGAFIGPAFGGEVLPESPEQALPGGRFHRVPVLLGTTRDEARFYVGLFAELAGSPVTAERYPRLVDEAFGDAAAEVGARYDSARFPTPALAWAQVCTDRAWAHPVHRLGRALAAHTDTWFYEFADRDAPAIVPLPGFPAGAHHSSELSYQFDLPGESRLSPAQRELADAMIRYWAAFAAHGDPAVDGLPAWPGFDSGRVQSLAPGRIGGTDYAGEHQLGFWAAVCGS